MYIKKFLCVILRGFTNNLKHIYRPHGELGAPGQRESKRGVGGR